MRIIPAINCQEFDQVKARVHVAQEILFGAGNEYRSTAEGEEWIHIDIADGGFTKNYSTWRNAEEFSQLGRDSRLKVEVHIMVNEPESVASQWLAIGVSRIIFHIETTASVEAMVKMCEGSNAQSMLALKPETPVSHAAPYLGIVDGCQVLAVEPGPGNQVMLPGMIEKIEALRKANPDLLIEVDGGVVPETIAKCRAAGADQVVSGSYIFNDENPAAAYGRLAENA